jgi:glc operon protein GlcG
MRKKPCLTHDDVRRIAEAARSAALAEKIAMSIAIVDDGGHLLSFERLDARASTITVATGKARTSALMRGPSGALESRIASQPALLALDAMPLQGGLPLMVDGDCVGAIGVSGGTGEQDERVASAGCRAL